MTPLVQGLDTAAKGGVRGDCEIVVWLVKLPTCETAMGELRDSSSQ